MLVSRSSVQRVCVEFTSMHGVMCSPKGVPCGIAQGMFCGQNCFFFCVGDVASRLHRCVGKQTECIIAVETLSHDFCSVHESTTFYIVQQILSVR